MTSTRNLNTTNNYKCEKKMNENLLGYLTNTIYQSCMCKLQHYDLYRRV